MHRTPLYSLQTHCISYLCIGILSLPSYFCVAHSRFEMVFLNSFIFSLFLSLFILQYRTITRMSPLLLLYILLYVIVCSFYCHVVFIVGHITTASATPHACTTGSCTQTSPLPLFVFFPAHTLVPRSLPSSDIWRC